LSGSMDRTSFYVRILNIQDSLRGDDIVTR
jgi:hypothetical protein